MSEEMPVSRNLGGALCSGVQTHAMLEWNRLTVFAANSKTADGDVVAVVGADAAVGHATHQMQEKESGVGAYLVMASACTAGVVVAATMDEAMVACSHAHER